MTCMFSHYHVCNVSTKEVNPIVDGLYNTLTVSEASHIDMVSFFFPPPFLLIFSFLSPPSPSLPLPLSPPLSLHSVSGQTTQLKTLREGLKSRHYWNRYGT